MNKRRKRRKYTKSFNGVISVRVCDEICGGKKLFLVRLIYSMMPFIDIFYSGTNLFVEFMNESWMCVCVAFMVTESLM